MPVDGRPRGEEPLLPSTRARFKQVYTTDLFGGAFFFEIVERRRGYAGFGAVNAPIRLAAQTLIAAQVDAYD